MIYLSRKQSNRFVQEEFGFFYEWDWVYWQPLKDQQNPLLQIKLRVRGLDER